MLAAAHAPARGLSRHWSFPITALLNTFVFKRPAVQASAAGCVTHIRTLRFVAAHQQHSRQARFKATPGNFLLPPVGLEDSDRSGPTVAESMQLTSSAFQEQRPKLLESLRRSSFVAFDLEFSGLGTAKVGLPPTHRRKQTLQECYEDTKRAVERYQLLQVGLCPIEWNEMDSMSFTQLWRRGAFVS